jgi:hypothetical protein
MSDAFDERQKALDAKVLSGGLDGVTDNERTEYMMGRLVGEVRAMGPVIGKALADGINGNIVEQTKVIRDGLAMLSNQHTGILSKVRVPAFMAGIGGALALAVERFTNNS